MSGCVLVVDDDADICSVVQRSLQRDGHDVDIASSGDEALVKLGAGPFDVILMDVHMPGHDGLETLELMRAQGHDQPVIIMSGRGTVEMAVRAVRRGALDFIEKPLRPSRIATAVDNALRCSKLNLQTDRTASGTRAVAELLGEGAAMRRLKEMIGRVARSEGRVLITGENGTGKELVARALHRGSARADGPFVKLNCAAVPSELIESELFGHEKGAFTGATTSRPGKFELAHGGTLFLDEVGDMPPLMQAKLLRVLQEGELERVGSTRCRSVDARVIAATNRDLAAMVADGDFREDLYYRLNVVALHVPALRERREDIPLLVPAFLAAAAKKNGRREPTCDPGFLAALAAHPFPGNVRELENTIERLVILGDGSPLTVADAEVARTSTRGAEPTSLYREGFTLKSLLADAERTIIEQALAANQGSMTKTATALGMERSHLYKKVRLLGIERSDG